MPTLPRGRIPLAPQRSRGWNGPSRHRERKCVRDTSPCWCRGRRGAATRPPRGGACVEWSGCRKPDSSIGCGCLATSHVLIGHASHQPCLPPREAALCDSLSRPAAPVPWAHMFLRRRGRTKSLDGRAMLAAVSDLRKDYAAQAKRVMQRLPLRFVKAWSRRPVPAFVERPPPSPSCRASRAPPRPAVELRLQRALEARMRKQGGSRGVSRQALRAKHFPSPHSNSTRPGGGRQEPLRLVRLLSVLGRKLGAGQFLDLVPHGVV